MSVTSCSLQIMLWKSVRMLTGWDGKTSVKLKLGIASTGLTIIWKMNNSLMKPPLFHSDVVLGTGNKPWVKGALEESVCPLHFSDLHSRHMWEMLSADSEQQHFLSRSSLVGCRESAHCSCAVSPASWASHRICMWVGGSVLLLWAHRGCLWVHTVVRVAQAH